MKRGLALLMLALSAGTLATTDALDTPLTATGDPVRGRGLFLAREGGHCVICHAMAGMAPTGTVGPALDGIGQRLSVGQIRQRIVDITQVKPDAAMPAFFRTQGLTRVAPAYAGKTLLDAQQVEDLVAFLSSAK